MHRARSQERSPKGYILTLERRLHQVEALLGTIISSDDPRARSLVQDLSRDKLANHIINKVRVGPFGPVGRTNHPFSTTKEDFLASITGDPGDSSSEQSGNSLDNQNDLAFMSPSSDWQDRLKGVLSSARAEASASTASMASPPPDTKLRRATYPSAGSPHTPVPYFPPTYHSPPPPGPQASGSYLYQYHTYAQSSAVRDTANQPDPPQVSAPMPVMCNIYTDVNGQFRTHETMAQGVDHGYRGTQSGFPGTMSEHATQTQYYNSFRR
ncbi:hypothetical protein BD413DRAFT_610580 [Trametes elegans]|nr:hypothetical protein BD413DRAFT_610580 [Trametes elegans]